MTNEEVVKVQVKTLEEVAAYLSGCSESEFQTRDHLERWGHRDSSLWCDMRGRTFRDAAKDILEMVELLTGTPL